MSSRRYTSGSINLESRDERKQITGRGIVYYDAADSGTEYRLWHGAVERIMQGAADNITQFDVEGRYNHDENWLLGRTTAGTLSLSTSERGVDYVIEESDTSQFRDVAEHIRLRNVQGSSFSFNLADDDDEWLREGDLHVRLIHRFADYGDIGPVNRPAYKSTTAGRMAGEFTEARASFDKYVDSLQKAERQMIKREAASRQRKLDMLLMNV